MSLRFDAVTLFPEMFAAITQSGITRRALDRNLWQLKCWNPREWTTDVHRTVDDRPYGGGAGMVMLAAPLEQAIDAIKRDNGLASEFASRVGAGDTVIGGRVGLARKVIYLSPQGSGLNQQKVLDVVAGGGAVLLCGRYEGVDERLIERCVDEELSLGDFVMSGGELAAMALIDACVRQLPGALNDPASAKEDSFADGLLDYPHYTRPEVYENRRVPDVLLSGNHERIRRWRLKQSLGRTWQRRPDLLTDRVLSQEDAELLREFQQDSD